MVYNIFMKTISEKKSKKIGKSTDERLTTLRLLGRTITIGPGTVPTSPTSVSATSIKDVISAARKASKLGVFDSAN